MSLPEHGARVATSAIDALRTQPVMLAVLMLNVIMFAAIAYAITSQRSQQHEIMKTMLEQNGRMVELIAKCSPDRSERHADPVNL